MTASSENKTYYITTPIYYVNDVPHIGHAYTSLACDVLARFKRLDGYDVMFLTGTDEHGQKVEKSAAAAGVPPLEFCDKVSKRFKELAEKMKFTNDDFIRTTEERHKLACQDLWKRLVERDEIYLGSYEGWYSVRDETFFTADEVVDGENGEKLAPTGAPVEWVEEPSYFFRLSKWQEPLLKFYEENEDFVLPKTRMNEVKSFVRGGKKLVEGALHDLSVSRTSFKWGVPVPDAPDHIMYVWIDALTNYMTAAGYPDQNSEAYKKFWPVVKHMVGKDIIRHHAVYWPAFLMAAELETPKRVFAHGWWTSEGQKISKSLGNVIDPFQIVDEFGLDAVRYFLMREVPFGNDGDFSRSSFISRMNSDLANDFGNLAQRSLSMIAKNCEGKTPSSANLNADDVALLNDITATLGSVREFADVEAINKMLDAIWKRIADLNAYFSNCEPWALKKTDPERMEAVLYTAVEGVRQLAIMVQPFMPDAMEKMLDQLAVPVDERTFVHVNSDFALKTGAELPKPEGVFPRFVEQKND
ncbi:MAG: methionine--tRNA ligase [Sphingomonadales bacterium]|nr:methionine--tRNA ligase [Sphingomonadales bacterium]